MERCHGGGIDMMSKLRRLLKNLILLLPEGLAEGILRIAGYRRVVLFYMLRLRARLPMAKSFGKYLADNSVYYVDPKKIVYAMNSEGYYDGGRNPADIPNKEFDVYKYQGRIMGGDWDRLERKFNDVDFYRSYEERASHGTGWEQLPYYRRVLAQIEAGIPKWDCRSKQDLDNRCQRLDQIFEDIKVNGYKSQRSLLEREGKKGKLTSLWRDLDEISVNIGRYGDLILNNGRHRLTMAKIAGVDKVPVKIAVRHAQWEVFKKEIEQYSSRNGGRVYAALTHIDLQHIPVHYSETRWDLIRNNLGEGNNTVLDIGAHWGFFCHKFEEEGLRCFAVEVEDENLYFLRKLRRAENREFAIIPKSIFNLAKEGQLKYDIVLALAIFHHFIKEQRTFEKLKVLLHSLDVNEMYFEPHLPDEPEMRGSYLNFSPQEFVDFIISNSCLNNYKPLGKCEEGKPIFKLWR
jgi:hypothetical protein